MLLILSKYAKITEVKNIRLKEHSVIIIKILIYQILFGTTKIKLTIKKIYFFIFPTISDEIIIIGAKNEEIK